MATPDESQLVERKSDYRRKAESCWNIDCGTTNGHWVIRVQLLDQWSHLL